MSNMAVAGQRSRHQVGLRELSQRTAKVVGLVRSGETVEITDRGTVVARIVPAADDRYAQLVAAGVIRPARRPFDIASLPEPGRATPAAAAANGSPTCAATADARPGLHRHLGGGEIVLSPSLNPRPCGSGWAARPSHC